MISFSLVPQVLFDRLSTLVGLHDHLQALNAFIGKIATNLKSYAKARHIHKLRVNLILRRVMIEIFTFLELQCKELIDHTLSVFLVMTSGYV